MKNQVLALGITAALLSVGDISLQAATSTWTGATDSLWITGNNWSPAGQPASGDDILFPGVANQTVDLVGLSTTIGSLSFNSANPYSLGTGGLTLGGDVSQNGAGAVDINVSLDLGGANRNFGGSGSGIVNLNGPVTDTSATGKRVLFAAGNWVIANSANTVDRFTVGSGSKVIVTGSVACAAYPASWYLGGDGVSGGFYAALDGGTLEWQATEPYAAWWTANTPTVIGSIDWNDRGVIFGTNGGTLIFNTAPPMSGPTTWYGLGGAGTVVVGEPLPYSGDPWETNAITGEYPGLDRFRSPFEVEYGFPLGPFSPGNLTKWRQGSGDLKVILTNGACAYLDWSAMTNGNLIISGQPGGDSSVIETNATGWTRNVGRLAIRGPHRNSPAQQYNIGNAPDAPAWAVSGVIDRSFYMPQTNGMVFYDAVQVWNRDGMERLACDMTFEPGSSVDFCSGARSLVLDLGHPGFDPLGAGPTNLITIKSGAKLNLNLQMRSNIGDGRRSPRGMSAGLRVWSFIDIKDGGQLKIYRSQTNCLGLTEVQAGDSGGNSGRWATKCIELFRPIIGSGSSASDARVVIDLPWSRTSGLQKSSGNSSGNNGVNWEANPTSMGGNYPGALPVVNGTGRYGLRVEGKAEYLTNFLYTVRAPQGGTPQNALVGLTGSGGVFTLAATDTNGTMTISDGPASNPNSIRLGLIGNAGFTYVLSAGTVANFGGILVKQGRVNLGNGLDMTGKNLRVGDEGSATVVLNDSATVKMGALVLPGDCSLEMGTAAGSGAVLNLTNSSAVAWTAGKTLTVVNWNGSLTGGGADQIKFGTDNTGLTTAQLAQVKWIAPNGAADVTGANILSTGEIVPANVAPTTISAPAVIGGQIVFGVVPGSPSQTSIIQWTTNLTSANWINVLTNTGAFNFTNSTTLPESYYRVLVQ